MCLTTRLKRQISSNDIECYKVLITDGDKYLSPYIRTSYQIPSDISDNVTEDIEHYNFESTSIYRIYSGFIHCYKYFEHAKHLTKFIIKKPYYNIVIVKCIVPKGTEFYQNCHEICAKRLKFIEVCV